ncbi:transcriptional antiterminator BglG [Paenibacillus yonginensis]|uniref:Ascorbate-specific PTS system EIIA component n=1 Tax=Paenibacillus yonginensis TaxID=1462996 RepID=A0A1B1N1E5_9BACL|nr:BglG family transcription antiterminator [Paenibacillus yonginensis]ANS75235.1 transcriptional antiterminator BglG [Paenibacillus yonginensis]
MILDERSAMLLKLLQQSSSLQRSELEAKTGLTRRQIQYGMAKVNDWLREQGYRPAEYDRKLGYYLADQIREEAFPEKLSKRTYVFSERDRQQLFYLMLFLADEPLSVYHFQSAAGVSRNTVLKDFQRFKPELQQHDLQIRYSKQRGYQIAGDARPKRYFMERLLFSLLHGTSREPVTAVLWSGPKGNTQLARIRQQLEVLERELGTVFADDRYQELAYLLLCTDRLIAKGDELPEMGSWQPLTRTREFKLLRQMTRQDRTAFPAEWSETECLYAALHVLGMNRTRDDISPLQGDEVIQELLREVVTEFERLACVQLQDKELFYEQLYLHFRPAYYRLLYRIEVANVMTERIRKVYPELFHLTKKSLQAVEGVTGYPVPDNEAAYFAIHFGGWLRRQQTVLDDRKRAIVVCPSGIGISRILILTLRELFPDILFLDALSVREAAHYPLAYDLVFSTVFLRTDAILFVIPPILDLPDKQKLRQQVMQELYGYAVPNFDVGELLKIIAGHATIHEPEQLEKALQSHLYTQAQQMNRHALEGAEKPVLEQLITEQTIQFGSHVADWREGIRAAAQPLVELGTIEERYVDAMIESVEDNGPYVVITPGVAIPHARPDMGVNSLSMSLLRLDEPVEFGPGKPVRLIIVLAAADRSSHLKALVQLTALLGNPAHIEDILQSPDKSVLLAYIHQYSKEESK